MPLCHVMCFTRKVHSIVTQLNILNIPVHGKGRHSMKTFSVAGFKVLNKLLTDELRAVTSILL